MTVAGPHIASALRTRLEPRLAPLGFLGPNLSVDDRGASAALFCAAGDVVEQLPEPFRRRLFFSYGRRPVPCVDLHVAGSLDGGLEEPDLEGVPLTDLLLWAGFDALACVVGGIQGFAPGDGVDLVGTAMEALLAA